MRKFVVKKHQRSSFQRQWVWQQGLVSEPVIGQQSLYSLLIGPVIKLKLSFTSEIRVAPLTKESIPPLDREQRIEPLNRDIGTPEQTGVYLREPENRGLK